MSSEYNLKMISKFLPLLHVDIPFLAVDPVVLEEFFPFKRKFHHLFIEYELIGCGNMTILSNKIISQ